LSLALGRTVDELLNSLSAAELAEWRQFYDLEPWGSDAEFYRVGIVAAMIGNVNRDPKKRPKPFTPRDFVPGWDKKEQPAADGMSPQRVRGALISAFGKRIKGNAGQGRVPNEGVQGDRTSPQRIRPKGRV
jgi:hypothetical protein